MTPRLLFRRVHLVTSLAVGLWLAVAGLAGSLLVFGDALDQALHPALFALRGPQRMPIDAAVASAERASGGRAMRVRLAGTATPVHEVWIDCDDCRRVWVDPSTARVNGIRSAHGTTRTFLHELHRRMLFRGPGDVAALLGGVALLLLALTGVILGWRGGLRVRRTGVYELHRAAGLLFAPLLAISASTGIYFIQAGLKAKPPSRVTPMRTSIDPLVRHARMAFPDAEPTWISLTSSEVVVRLKQPAEKHPNGRTFVRFDASGAIAGRVDALRVARGQRFLDSLYPLHTGATGGIVHRLLLVIAGTTPAFFFVTGVVLWLRRVRARRRSQMRWAAYVPATETFSKTSVGVRIEE